MRNLPENEHFAEIVAGKEVIAARGQRLRQRCVVKEFLHFGAHLFRLNFAVFVHDAICCLAFPSNVTGDGAVGQVSKQMT